MQTRSCALLVLSMILPLLAATAAAPQSTRKPFHLGVILPAAERPLDMLRKGLAELGYVEGKTLVIESRVARAEPSRLEGFAEELVRLDVDAIAVVGLSTAKAAQKATKTIPIVFAIVIDPVRGHLVASYARPGSNITGITNLDPEQPRKQLELLKQTVPNLMRIAVISDSTVPDLLTVSTARRRKSSVCKLNRSGSTPIPISMAFSKPFVLPVRARCSSLTNRFRSSTARKSPTSRRRVEYRRCSRAITSMREVY